MSRTWTANDPRWQSLTPYQRAAAMSLLEADGARFDDARNVLGAILNRSQRTGEDLGEHVSKPIYQPTIEPAQQARLARILAMPEFRQLTDLAQRRATGQEADWVQGATHFLAPEKTMLNLHRSNPDKYHNWGPLPNSRGKPGQNWTGYDPATGSYRGVVMRDGSHAFLIPGTDGKPVAAPAPQNIAAAPATAAPESPAISAPAEPQAPAGAPSGGLLGPILAELGVTPAAQPAKSQDLPDVKLPAMPDLQISYPKMRRVSMPRQALARAAMMRGRMMG
jgi:hypothetical protein